MASGRPALAPTSPQLRCASPETPFENLQVTSTTVPVMLTSCGAAAWGAWARAADGAAITSRVPTPRPVIQRCIIPNLLGRDNGIRKAPFGPALLLLVVVSYTMAVAQCPV